ncbi:hypothetical protein MHB48_13405 [Psychrobacillus sp. FSL H8-0483]|uniref:hypothetical protein n=1 Tax=Psychrobacillus sp. FSL H8-0483 TaxID=2921389 RepID=UPI00315ABD4E
MTTKENDLNRKYREEEEHKYVEATSKKKEQQNRGERDFSLDNTTSRQKDSR